MATEAPNPLAMSDEDILNMSEPPVVEAATVETDTSEKEVEVEDKSEAVVEEKTEEESTEGASDDSQNVDNEAESKPDDVVTESGASEAKPDEKSEAKPEDKPEDKPGEAAAEVEAPDYEAFYKGLIEQPLKANGKEIKLNNIEEVRTLMQQGANYTRKMQELAPVRKSMLMLQNNGLLDDAKLSFLIDLEKGDPEAIKKFLKDKNIDPMDLDTSSEPDYKPGNHQVTDAEVSFDDVLSDVASTSEGRKTLSVINTTWDEKSKEALGASPEIMSVIHQQRETGIYDQITTEMNRRIALGLMPASTPFLSGYKTVGDELAAAALGTTATEAKPEPTVVVTRAATPKPKIENGDKAAAASPTRAAPKQAEEKKNFLSMSDEEFNKQSDVLLGRV